MVVDCELVVCHGDDAMAIVLDAKVLEAGLGNSDVDAGGTCIERDLDELDGKTGRVVDGLIAEDEAAEGGVELRDASNGGHDGQREMKHW